MDAGTVLKWNNFSDRQYEGEIKPRWFVYLGNTGPLTNPCLAYLFTTTTQIDKFAPGGARDGHTYCLFSPTNSPFEFECVLDFHEEPYYRSLPDLTNNQNIEIRGKLIDQDMRMVYNKMLRSPVLSKIQKTDIHASFNRSGIEGLKMPK